MGKPRRIDNSDLRRDNTREAPKRIIVNMN